MKKKNKFIYIFLAVVCICVLCFCCVKISNLLSEYKQGEDTYESIAQCVTFDNAQNNTAQQVDYPNVDFDKLLKQNDDTVGWIYCEDTIINYPIVQGDDNVYYLKHMFNGDNNSCGSIFMDYCNNADFSDFNTIIYGHHMKNNKMFSPLMKYKKQQYYDEYNTALIMTPTKNYQLKFFAGYVAKTDDNAWNMSFANDEEKQMWLDSICQKSCFSSDVTPTTSDHIVTLSTCSYEFNNARFVLFGFICD